MCFELSSTHYNSILSQIKKKSNVFLNFSKKVIEIYLVFREKIRFPFSADEKEDTFMNMDKKTYEKFVKARMPKSPIVKNCVFAFLIGGTICALAEGFFQCYLSFSIPEEQVKTLVPVTLVFLAALLTGLGVFDDIARFAGAGTLVPITGFANAVASPAIESKSEGFVLGVGAKMFTIAGPVIVYGVLSSIFYGVVLWALGL